MKSTEPIILCTRGSPLALFQAKQVQAQAAREFPRLRIELKILKTTGDALQTADPSDRSTALPMGLFTKELEQALMQREAHIAVHSLKDLPTELPDELCLAGVGRREDVRDVLLYREKSWMGSHSDPTEEWRPGDRLPKAFSTGTALSKLPENTVVATGSTRRAAQLQALCPHILVIPIRGNVGTRLRKLSERRDFDATLLAMAGLNRLGLRLNLTGHLTLDGRNNGGDRPPDGLSWTVLETRDFLPAVGQGAIGLEARQDDEVSLEVCRRLTHTNTRLAVEAERDFLRTLGGGCQSPIGAYAQVIGHQLVLQGILFQGKNLFRSEQRCALTQSAGLGRKVAEAVLKAAHSGRV